VGPIEVNESDTIADLEAKIPPWLEHEGIHIQLPSEVIFADRAPPVC
jgi:hypothetical protein